MPLYRVSLKFAWDVPNVPARKWSNTFYTVAPSALSASAAGLIGWTGALRQATRERVYLYAVYSTDLNPATDDYYVLNVEPGLQRGSLPYPASQPYLPKACLSVTIPVGGSRPSRKFWRPALTEDDIVNGITVSPALVGAVQQAWDDFIVNGEGIWVDPDSQQWEAPTQLKLTTREFGRESTADVPAPPPLG